MVAAVSVVAMAGCGGPHRRSDAAAKTTTTLLGTDHWSPPAVSGAPSATKFCTVLEAMYRHEAEIPVATTAVKEQILRDYVATVPEAIAAAPADIAGAAKTYLTSVATILSAVASAGLDYNKIKRGTLTPLLLDPQIKTAGDQVLSYSQTQCHYTIGGA